MATHVRPGVGWEVGWGGDSPEKSRQAGKLKWEVSSRNICSNQWVCACVWRVTSACKCVLRGGGVSAVAAGFHCCWRRGGVNMARKEG